MISSKGKYALRIMIDIAINSEANDIVSLKSITNKENVSIKYLQHIMSLLVKNELLNSIRGNSGGYKLTKESKEYTIYEILSSVEGSLLPVPYVNEDEVIDRSIKPFFNELNILVENYLKSKTLYYLVEQYKDANYDFVYNI